MTVFTVYFPELTAQQNSFKPRKRTKDSIREDEKDDMHFDLLDPEA